MVSWALALEVTGLTLLLLRMCVGANSARLSPSRSSSFLVAVPWPTVVESPLVRALTSIQHGNDRGIARWVGIPASSAPMSSKIATGVVGIDEACSGIRSLQATLMLSLFFGQLYRLPLVRRPTLLLTGFVLANGSEHWPTLCSLRLAPTRASRPYPSGTTLLASQSPYLLLCSLLFSLRLRNKGA